MERLMHATTKLGNIHGGSGTTIDSGTVADAEEYLNDQAYQFASEGYFVRDNRPSRLAIGGSRGTTWLEVRVVKLAGKEEAS